LSVTPGRRARQFPLHTSLAPAATLSGCTRPEAEPEPIRAVRTMQVSNGAAQPTREFAAETRARTGSRLSFRVAGKIVSREVDLGRSVKAGQALACLGAEDLQQGQKAARAALAAAQANLDQAAADHQRVKDLRDQGFISAAELERRATTLETARAHADPVTRTFQAKADLGSAPVQLGQTATVIVRGEPTPGRIACGCRPSRDIRTAPRCGCSTAGR
jgi:membrane fusion protein, multidrug efflux system